MTGDGREVSLADQITCVCREIAMSFRMTARFDHPETSLTILILAEALAEALQALDEKSHNRSITPAVYVTLARENVEFTADMMVKHHIAAARRAARVVLRRAGGPSGGAT